jgi:hypothetical protein
MSLLHRFAAVPASVAGRAAFVSSLAMLINQEVKYKAESPHSLIGAENSLLSLRNSLFDRVGNLALKARKTKGKFGEKIATAGDFCENSLLNSLLAGNS